jgi:hypothetical protein
MEKLGGEGSLSFGGGPDSAFAKKKYRKAKQADFTNQE